MQVYDGSSMFPAHVSMKHNFDIGLQHIPGVGNAIADALSRFKNEELQELTPHVDFEMTPQATIKYMQSLLRLTNC